MKILLIDFLYIGDLVFITPAIRMLATAFPEATIDVLVKQLAAPILVHHPLLRRVTALDIKPGRNIDAPWTFWRWLSEVRRERYDWVITLQDRNERASLLAGFSGAQQIGGYVHPALKWLYDQPIAETCFPDIHLAEHFLGLLERIGVPRMPHRGLEMWPGAEAECQADARWEAAGLTGNARVIGLNPGARIPIKQWTAEGFAAVADRLAAEGYTPVLFGGPLDVRRAEEICARATHPPVVFTGAVDLLELAALIRKCACFITGDTGPMHIAASQQVPVVALFGPTDVCRYYPYGVPHRVIASSARCPTCVGAHCPNIFCMKAITVEQVMENFHALLAEKVGVRS